jgi:hypothetical protein
MLQKYPYYIPVISSTRMRTLGKEAIIYFPAFRHPLRYASPLETPVAGGFSLLLLLVWMLMFVICLTFDAVNVDRVLGDKRHLASELPMTGHYKPSSETCVVRRVFCLLCGTKHLNGALGMRNATHEPLMI